MVQNFHIGKFKINQKKFMNKDILSLEPQAIWKHFTALNAVQRPSKKEARVIAFMKAFGASLDLET